MYISSQISALSFAQKFTPNFTLFQRSSNQLVEKKFEIRASLKIIRNYRHLNDEDLNIKNGF